MNSSRSARQKAAPIGAAFYDRDPALVARELLGATLTVREGRTSTAGRIVETEAYLGPHDAACHATAGRTTRTWHLFGPAGTAYVYRIYGIHWCVNAVTREEGFGSAVLIRALEPVAGVARMRARRGVVTSDDDSNNPTQRVNLKRVQSSNASPTDATLCNGPGKLCQALAIDRRHDGMMLTGGNPITIEHGDEYRDDRVMVGPRIGISKAADLPLRFWVHGARVVRAKHGELLATSRGQVRDPLR